MRRQPCALRTCCGGGSARRPSDPWFPLPCLGSGSPPLGLTLAAVIPILQASSATSTSAELQALENERAALQAEVRLIASQVGELASLQRVADAARERLRLTPAEPTTVLHIDAPPPPRVLPRRLLPPEDRTFETKLSWCGNKQ